MHGRCAQCHRAACPLQLGSRGWDARGTAYGTPATSYRTAAEAEGAQCVVWMDAPERCARACHARRSFWSRAPHTPVLMHASSLICSMHAWIGKAKTVFKTTLTHLLDMRPRALHGRATVHSTSPSGVILSSLTLASLLHLLVRLQGFGATFMVVHHVTPRSPSAALTASPPWPPRAPPRWRPGSSPWCPA
jgi:hypothetical protein